MDGIGSVLNAMIGYYESDIKRINHFIKVYGFARAIGEGEGLSENTMRILGIAALTHDIGIKNSEIKYKSAAGTYQQTEGPPEARKMLEGLNIERDVTDRVCWLIAHHHTYSGIEGADYQILVEADFIVNAFEDVLPGDAIRSFRDKVFKTKSGTMILNTMYSLD
jgi:HD superfamily phosphodiesterase